MTDARERLLTATMEYIAEHGVGDLSLRQLAGALGTSHRMLNFHFGSKEGLLVEVVRAVEQRQMDFLNEITSDDTLGPVEFLREMWAHLIDPQLAPYERLFFEIYGQALQGQPHTAELLVGIVDMWIEPLAQIIRRAGVSPAAARDDARLFLAVTRALLLDLLSTQDEAAVTRALERFLAHYQATLASRASRPDRKRRRAS